MKSLKKIAVIGLGGLGVPVFLRLLNEPSEFEIEVFDSDVVDVSNLHRQILFRDEDISKSKLDVLEELLLKEPFSNNCQNKNIKLHKLKILKDHLSVLNDFDLVIDCTDDPIFKFTMNDYCKLKNKILIHAGAQGEQGLVFSVIPTGPCLRCLFGDPDTMGMEELCASCRTSGILGAYSGLTGIYQAELAINVLRGESTAGAFKIDSRGVREIEIEKSLECPICSETKRLDLRDVRCPETFVYAKLALLKRSDPKEKIIMQFNNEDDLQNVKASIIEEGYRVNSSFSQLELNTFQLLVS